MVDLGIDMVWSSGKDNTASSGFFKVIQDFLAFGLYILTGPVKLFPCFLGGIIDFIGGNIGERCNESLGCYFKI